MYWVVYLSLLSISGIFSPLINKILYSFKVTLCSSLLQLLEIAKMLWVSEDCLAWICDIYGICNTWPFVSGFFHLSITVSNIRVSSHGHQFFFLSPLFILLEVYIWVISTFWPVWIMLLKTQASLLYRMSFQLSRAYASE